MTDGPELDPLMGVAARAAAGRRAFLGWVLAEYQKAEGLDDAGLARHLGVELRTVPSLCLCLRPRSDQFLQDVEQIAGEFGCDADALVAVVRHVEFFDVARDAPGMSGASGATDAPVAPDAGRLMAARSRPPKRRRRGGGDQP